MNPVIEPRLQAAFEAERRAVATRKAADAAQSRLQTIRMYGRLAELQETLIRERNVNVACTRGCAYCCHLRVEIRPHEAFVLARHIEEKLSPPQRAEALARLDANLARIATLSKEQHIRAGIPCAFLVDGACSVYEGRPATCRKYYSVSVDTCRNAYNDTAAPLTGDIEDEQVRLAGNAVALGYAKGLEDDGLDAALYELHGAVKSALSNPKAERRYRDGKKPFV